MATLQDYRLRKFRTIKAFAEAYGCGATRASAILNGKHHFVLSKGDVRHLAEVLGIGFVECADACDNTYAQLNGYRKDGWKRTAKTYKGIWARWAWEEGILRDVRKADVTNDWEAFRAKYIPGNTSSSNNAKSKQAPPITPVNCFALLGIAPTSDVLRIKTAFRNKVKAAADGKGGYVGDMHRLVLAKEQALAYAVKRK